MFLTDKIARKAFCVGGLFYPIINAFKKNNLRHKIPAGSRRSYKMASLLKRVQDCYTELRKLNCQYLGVLGNTNETDILSTTAAIKWSMLPPIAQFLSKCNILYEQYYPKIMSDHCRQICFDAVF